jgi:hypothetical protein
MALFEGLVISIAMILLRKFWGYMYSNEEEVVTYITRMMPVLAMSFFIDGIHTSLSGKGNTMCRPCLLLPYFHFKRCEDIWRFGVHRYSQIPLNILLQKCSTAIESF